MGVADFCLYILIFFEIAGKFSDKQIEFPLHSLIDITSNYEKHTTISSKIVVAHC